MCLSFEIIKDLFQKNRNFCSSDYDDSIFYIKNLLPGKVMRFHSSNEINGWKIPPKWDLKNANIKSNNNIILDATKHPLQVIGLSAEVNEEIKGVELKKHLYYQTINEVSEDAIPFHFRQFYNSWNRDYGFCVDKNFYHSITDDQLYHVVIETVENDGYLDIYEYFHQGVLDYTITFVAHLDHPGMANDDLAGCAVGIELFKNIQQLKTKYSYRLLLVQEIIGSVYYLDSINEKDLNKNLGSLFLEMLGSRTPLKLQSSYSENPLQIIIERKLKSENQLFSTDEKLFYGFRELIGNDEIVFESYGIPMSSLSRFPYKEYHSSKDDLSIIDESALTESVEFLKSLIKDFDKEYLVVRNFEGLLALSNPKYDLYVDPLNIEHVHAKGLRHLMDFMAVMKRPYTFSELSLKFDLPLNILEDYLKLWENKKLIKIH